MGYITRRVTADEFRSQRLTRRQLRQCIFALALVLFCAQAGFAASLSEYHQHVKQALNALDLFNVTDESLTETQRFTYATANIRAAREALPPTENVDWGGTSFSVDNSWFHQELKEFEDPSHSNSTPAQALMPRWLCALPAGLPPGKIFPANSRQARRCACSPARHCRVGRTPWLCRKTRGSNRGEWGKY